MKDIYRNYFAKLDFLNWAFICKACDVNVSNFYCFMAGQDSRLSEKKCKLIREYLITQLKSLG